MKRATALCLSTGLHALVVVSLLVCYDQQQKAETIVRLDMSLIAPSQAEHVVADAPVVPLDPPPSRSTAEIERDFVLPFELTEPADAVETFKVVERLPEKSQKDLRPEIRLPDEALNQAKVEAPPKPLQNIRPEYPRSARRRGVEGDVVLSVHVTEEGSVADARVSSSSGFSELDAAALKAVCAAKFVPAQAGGQPVSAKIVLSFQFHLR